MSSPNDLPTFDQLPKVDGLPQGCTWGLWDKDGQKDDLGTLNLLTAEVMKEAAKEIEHGVSVALSWCMTKPHAPNFMRQPLEHKVIDHNDIVPGYKGFDDQLHFNSQCSSQWDGLRHHAHIASSLFYNGVTKQDIFDDKPANVLGTQRWTERGGIIGRGVLIDYVAYAARHNITYSPVKTHTITLSALNEAAKEQKVEFKHGDILLVRSGFTKWYNECSDTAERDRVTSQGHTFAGVTPTEESIAWIWNQHFAAVAGDAPTWESLPPPPSGLLFHDYLISLFGMPIGEFWDLEKLAETCERLGRYSFFLTSAPLNVPGGVASPPNSLAIF